MQGWPRENGAGRTLPFKRRHIGHGPEKTWKRHEKTGSLASILETGVLNSPFLCHMSVF